MAEGSQPSSGAARKARERKARANARHVQWLASSFQVLASHHTRAASVCHASVEDVASLRRELESLRVEVASLRASAREVQPQPVVQDEQGPVATNQEKDSYVSKVIQPASVQHQHQPAKEKQLQASTAGGTVEAVHIPKSVEVAGGTSLCNANNPETGTARKGHAQQSYMEETLHRSRAALQAAELETARLLQRRYAG